jgi:hypothetical protein
MSAAARSSARTPCAQRQVPPHPLLARVVVRAGPPAHPAPRAALARAHRHHHSPLLQACSTHHQPLHPEHPPQQLAHAHPAYRLSPPARLAAPPPPTSRPGGSATRLPTSGAARFPRSTSCRGGAKPLRRLPPWTPQFRGRAPRILQEPETSLSLLGLVEERELDLREAVAGEPVVGGLGHLL